MLFVGRREEPVGEVDVGRQNFDAVGTGIIQKRLHLVALVHHHAEVGRHEAGREVRLEVGRLIGDIGIGRSMRLVEAVTCELFHQVEDFGCNRRLHAALPCALHEDRTLALHFLDVLLAHGAAQKVGAAQRITAHHLGHTHHLFLIHHDAVGFGKHGRHALVQILHLLPPELSGDEGRNQVHRTRAIKCVQGHQILETVGTRLTQQLTHAFRFKLEDGGRIGVLEAAVGLLVCDGNALQLEFPFGIELVDVLLALRKDGERRKPQEVELHETDILHVLLVELADRIFGSAIGVVERTEIRKRPRSDQHAARVHAEVAGDALKPLCHTHEFLVLVVALNRLAELGHLLDGIIKRDVLAGLHRNELGQTVRLREGDVEHACNVTHDGLGTQRAEGRDLTHGVRTVRLLHVFDRAVAVVLAEVHVKVRHGHALRIQEAFEQKVELERIKVRNAERIGDKRTCARTSSRAHGHAVGLRPVDEVLNDEEVARKLHPLDNAELIVKALHVFRALGVPHLLVVIKEGQTLLQTLTGEMVHVVVQTHAVRRREERQLRFRKHPVKIAALRDDDGIGQRARNVLEELAHLLLALQVLLARIALVATGVGDREAARNTAAHFVRLEVLRLEELNGMSRHNRNVKSGGHRHEEGILIFVLRSVGTLEFDVETVRKELLPASDNAARLTLAARVNELRQASLGAACQRDEAVRGTGHIKPFVTDLTAIRILSLQKRLGEQNAQGVVPRVVHAVERHPVGIVGELVVLDLDVAAEDGLETGGERMRVKAQAAEDVHQVRNAERHPAHFKSLVNGGVDAHEPVRDGILGVKTKMNETGLSHDLKQCSAGLLQNGEFNRGIGGRHGRSRRRRHHRLLHVGVHHQRLQLGMGAQEGLRSNPAHCKEGRAKRVRSCAVAINDRHGRNVGLRRPPRLRIQNMGVALAVLLEVAFVGA